jgi:glycosyltransferase involved in cell wall biosynthesis
VGGGWNRSALSPLNGSRRSIWRVALEAEHLVPEHVLEAKRLRVTVIHHEFPYPPNHGGKADVWSRLVGLRRLGIQIQLVYWHEGRSPSPADLELVHGIAPKLIRLTPRARWLALFVRHYPPRARRFVPAEHEYQEVKAKIQHFKPRLLMLDGWPACLTAARLSAELSIPFTYRSQNVEHEYWKTQSEIAKGLHRLRLRVTAKRMATLERQIRRDAHSVLEISAEDADRMRALGWEGKSVVLPPTWLGESAESRTWDERDIDVLFVGNLWAPDNVDGLLWFFNSVLGTLERRVPGVRVLIAGSRPSSRFRRACRSRQVTCLANPPDVQSLYARARVMINPQLRGSGVSMKMLEFLARDAWVISTPVGARGLPDPKPANLRLESDPGEFAGAIASAMARRPESSAIGRHYLTTHFGTAQLAQSVLPLLGPAGIVR